jgi:hypothetical protein
MFSRRGQDYPPCCQDLHNYLQYFPILLLQAHTIPTVVLHNYISRYCTTNPPRACLPHVSRSGPTSLGVLAVLLHLVCARQ